MKIGSVVSAIFLLLSPCFSQLKEPITAESGLISGVPGRDTNITAFKGIPYAEPPVGNLRWVPPSAPRAWTGVRKADHFSDGCSQVFPKGDFPKSEDCLYLNVWTPAKTSADALPVMVWIHGGGLQVGCSCEPLYDGEELARMGIVVVTLNYRLNIFGFYAHPELVQESPHHAAGNYGLLDQLAALEWVQHNIRAFGGDPQKVTIFGQSGGAFSVIAQLASPLSKGVFRGAISESGGVGAGFMRSTLPSLQDSEAESTKVADSLGAHSLTELRALPAEKLLQAGGFRQANVDGWFLPESPVDSYAAGKINNVSVILGSNSDEAQHFLRSALSAKEYVDKAHKDYGADAPKFLSLYPGDTDETAKVSQQRQFADRTAFGEQKLATEIAHAGSKVYLYFFDYLDEGGYNSEPATLGLRLGADHGAELPYVFGLLNHWKTAVPGQDLKLQNTVMQYWTNFAKTLNPNGGSLSTWDSFNGTDGRVMVFEKNVGMRQHPRAAEINFFRSHATN